MVIPSGYDVEGHVVDVKSAGKFAATIAVELQLESGIAAGGKYYKLQTDQYSRRGLFTRQEHCRESWRRAQAFGAIIGGFAGGGKGAAIGARANPVVESGWRRTSRDQGPADQVAFGNRAELYPTGFLERGASNKQRAS